MSEEFNRKGYHPPKVVKNGECVNCNLCEMICPDFAIFSTAVDRE
ncbi:MAG: 4Fe-4S ferredoxin, partial [Pseudomonas stutzeri]|nr:4Fe-4S ferredoxin [Stutzerimonas stutzeri]